MRYTSTDARRSFVVLCRLLGKREAADQSDVGGWMLDQTPLGYCVAEVYNTDGALWRPLGTRRRTAREFCDCVEFLLEALTGKRLVDEQA